MEMRYLNIIAMRQWARNYFGEDTLKRDGRVLLELRKPGASGNLFIN